MRVVSGSAKGRTLKAVPGMGTRPTTDKVKEAVFSMIGPYFSGGMVLDLFAGTGGLGIEALSRGMERAILVDSNRGSIETIQENLRTTGLSSHAEVYRNDAFRAVKALAKRGARLDLVFLDPPYKMKNMDELLSSVEAFDLFNPQATVVIEHDASHDYPRQIGGLHHLRHAEYGDTAITVYQYEGEQESARGKI